MPSLLLPNASGALVRFECSEPLSLAAEPTQPWSREVYAAAHVVADPLSPVDPWLEPAIDWDRTMAYREHLWRLGFGVAEAMDTAQRGMGLDWGNSLDLIGRSVAASKAFGKGANGRPARVASGAGTDHLVADASTTIADVIAAYEQQIASVEAVGGQIILMASRALAAVARSADDYAHVYDHVLSQVREPVIIHWLGDMFDPALAGYWGDADLDRATDVAVEVLNRNAAKVDGVKVSLLNKDREVAMRARLAPGIRMYTGDDFNFAELIAGSATGHTDVQGEYSDALLGIFDAIAPVASSALSALTEGNAARFHELLGPTVPLSRHIFKVPTRFYKTGVVFMAWLNGHQDHFVMVNGQQSTRNLLHLAELFRLADAAGLLRDPAMACRRMASLMAVNGVDAAVQPASLAHAA